MPLINNKSNNRSFYEVVVPLICRSFRLMMKWYSVKSTVAESNDVKMISNTEIITHNNGRGVIIDEWEKLDNDCF
ncbi:hypothetical protein H8356DRAFT_1331738 [Neocallimastix lanati (nom. inval.)]|nr:hypothetical protein H8356DRAFT_1331738 [Neocallimastix sp. JGI-2020a]